MAINRFRHRTLLLALAAVLAPASAFSAAAVDLDRTPAAVTRAEAGRPLTPAAKAAPEAIVAGYLRGRGLAAEVIASLRSEAAGTSTRGITNLRLSQEIDGLRVHGAYLKAAINDKGELIHLIDRLADVSAVQPSGIDAQQALAAAMSRLHPDQRIQFRANGTQANTTRFDGGAFFEREPSVTAVVLPLANGSLARGWVVETWAAATNQLHHTTIDGDGQVLDVESRTANDSYNVFVEDPLKGPQAIVSGPGAGNAQSPAGWLAGTQTTINITGNNANAYLDADGNNRPDRGGTAVTNGNFLTAVDLSAQPSTSINRAVAVQNLFYLNNVVHDILYTHGFNEAAGNFQVNNFGKGGNGGDPVKAEAQDGSGTDNANFATPADGSAPRMQMFLWNSKLASAEVVAAGVPRGAFPSSFGPALTTTGVTYPLATVATDGCLAMANGSLSNRMAIIDRGNCNFTTKVLNAQNAGAKAVVIVNNVPTGDFGPGGTERRVKIPSAMVSQADGAVLKFQAGTNGTLRKKAVAPLMIDGDLDADIVFHEYGHGLSWRMIGGMSGPLAGAIGEGASDTLAFLINGDDVIGEYSWGEPGGIRRAPYEGYPLTYASVTGLEVHDDGEIYAGAMWKVRANYLAAGLSASDVLDDFVDGMNYTPSTPTFEQMRDGMLQSASGQGATSAARVCAIWSGFADRGIGLGAQGLVSGSSVSITESFAIPAGVCP